MVVVVNLCGFLAVRFSNILDSSSSLAFWLLVASTIFWATLIMGSFGYLAKALALQKHEQYIEKRILVKEGISGEADINLEKK